MYVVVAHDILWYHTLCQLGWSQSNSPPCRKVVGGVVVGGMAGWCSQRPSGSLGGPGVFNDNKIIRRRPTDSSQFWKLGRHDGTDCQLFWNGWMGMAAGWLLYFALHCEKGPRWLQKCQNSISGLWQTSPLLTSANWDNRCRYLNVSEDMVRKKRLKLPTKLCYYSKK